MKNPKPETKKTLQKYLPVVNPWILPNWVKGKIKCLGVGIVHEDDIDFNTYEDQVRTTDNFGKRLARLLKTFLRGYDPNQKPPTLIKKPNGKYALINGFGRHGKNKRIKQKYDIYQIVEVKKPGMEWVVKKLSIWFNRSEEERSPNTKEDIVNVLLEGIESKDIQPKGSLKDWDVWEKVLKKVLVEIEPQRDDNVHGEIIQTTLENIKHLIGPKKIFSYSKETLKDLKEDYWAKRSELDPQTKYDPNSVPQPDYGFLITDKLQFNPDGPGDGVFQQAMNQGREESIFGGILDRYLHGSKDNNSTRAKTELIVDVKGAISSKESLHNRRQKIFDNMTKIMKRVDNLLVEQGGKTMDWTKVFEIIAIVPQYHTEDKVQWVNPDKFNFDYYHNSKGN